LESKKKSNATGLQALTSLEVKTKVQLVVFAKTLPAEFKDEEVTTAQHKIIKLNTCNIQCQAMNCFKNQSSCPITAEITPKYDVNRDLEADCDGLLDFVCSRPGQVRVR
jgi:hypothetical protein